MTTEASKSDLTALLTQHDLEALPGKIAAEVAAQVVAALTPKAPLVRIHVGGVEIPFLEFYIMQGETRDGRELRAEACFVVESKYADLLQLSNTVKILEGDPAVAVFTGQLQSREREVSEGDLGYFAGNTIVCRAVAAAADLPLWERKGSLQPLETLPFVEKTTQADRQKDQRP